jgi:hypothetical protein
MRIRAAAVGAVLLAGQDALQWQIEEAREPSAAN